MAHLRSAFYIGAVSISLLAVASGCGKAPAPPPGAPKEEQEKPSIDLGSETGSPKESGTTK